MWNLATKLPTADLNFAVDFGSFLAPLDSRRSFPATEPPDPRRASAGFEKGSVKGSLKGFRRVFEGF